VCLSPASCLEEVAEDFEILEVEVVDKEDMVVETVLGIEAGIVVEGIEVFPCMQKGAAENFLKGFDKQNPAQGCLFVNSSHCCLN